MPTSDVSLQDTTTPDGTKCSQSTWHYDFITKVCEKKDEGAYARMTWSKMTSVTSKYKDSIEDDVSLFTLVSS